jgi:glyoxylase-like metal-dependent hydrolase (beta-lactamase superfamily II)
VRVSVLASGSGGNACVVESGATRVLVDAGLSGREIERRMRDRGMEPESIAAVFVTHEHTDHSSGALAFSGRWGCPIYATDGTAHALGLEGDLFSPFVPVEAARDRRIGSIGYRAYATPHDANASVAYAFEADDARIVIASDIGRVEPAFVDAPGRAVHLVPEEADLRRMGTSLEPPVRGSDPQVRRPAFEARRRDAPLAHEQPAVPGSRVTRGGARARRVRGEARCGRPDPRVRSLRRMRAVTP